MTIPGSLKFVQQAATEFPADFLVGAGTVLDGETAEKAICAGAVSSPAQGASPK